ncbi:MAG: 4-hydroxy-tetrahydrodipicolinate reductase [Bacteroidia bacterium]
MKIALLGYGKMGKTIEAIALKRGHTIVLKLNKETAATTTDSELKAADVAIEFSTPDTAVPNILRCFCNSIPVVAGTTGWLGRMENVKTECAEKEGGFFYASNFSIGVNLFFHLNQKLAKLMSRYPEYRASMEEIHHIHKLDSPSGTAISLAKEILSNNHNLKNYKDYPGEFPAEFPADELPVHSKRIGEVPGTHSVNYTSAVDKITITHEAFNREGFAMGAVLAAEFMVGKKGVYGMEDLLG